MLSFGRAVGGAGSGACGSAFGGTGRSFRAGGAGSTFGGGTGRSFRDSTGKIYFELADLLLSSADSAASAPDLSARLKEARDTVELLKTVEVEDYFLEDDCVNLLGAKVRPLETVAQKAAVIYVIPLEDRTELLLSLPSGIKRLRSPVGAQELTEEARRFRIELQDPNALDYQAPAQKLWTWLIRPMEELLRQERVETLVFVPDGALQTIPMAALHDGQHYLIETYAVAVSPGLSLMEPRPMPRDHLSMLACGVSQSVRGFPALASVPRELTNVMASFGGKQLLNTDFLTENFQREVAANPYSVIHLASHGEFGSDVSETFILTYDGKLTLDRLEALIRPRLLSDQPLELLTLSACQTAAGDDRAALGLAGVAVKSGARSALATLWNVNDEATERVMSEFYATLRQDKTLSKAQALRKAQRSLLASEGFRHPCYWAPYLIIGNWL